MNGSPSCRGGPCLMLGCPKPLHAPLHAAWFCPPDLSHQTCAVSPAAGEPRTEPPGAGGQSAEAGPQAGQEQAALGACLCAVGRGRLGFSRLVGIDPLQAAKSVASLPSQRTLEFLGPLHCRRCASIERASSSGGRGCAPATRQESAGTGTRRGTACWRVLATSAALCFPHLSRALHGILFVTHMRCKQL